MVALKAFYVVACVENNESNRANAKLPEKYLIKIGRDLIILTSLCSSQFLFQVPILKPMELMVEASPRRIFANAHTYHINSISINSDGETYLSADDLR
jgi:hypothetical protein